MRRGASRRSPHRGEASRRDASGSLPPSRVVRTTAPNSTTGGASGSALVGGELEVVAAGPDEAGRDGLRAPPIATARRTAAPPTTSEPHSTIRRALRTEGRGGGAAVSLGAGGSLAIRSTSSSMCGSTIWVGSRTAGRSSLIAATIAGSRTPWKRRVKGGRASLPGMQGNAFERREGVPWGGWAMEREVGDALVPSA